MMEEGPTGYKPINLALFEVIRSIRIFTYFAIIKYIHHCTFCLRFTVETKENRKCYFGKVWTEKMYTFTIVCQQAKVYIYFTTTL